MKVLVTGGAGFIGSSFIRYVLRMRNDIEIVNFDKLTYAGNLRNLEEIALDPRYSFVRGDIAEPDHVAGAFKQHHPDVIVNFAAETHVDRSIDGPAAFIQTNIVGTFTLLDAAR